MSVDRMPAYLHNKNNCFVLDLEFVTCCWKLCEFKCHNSVPHKWGESEEDNFNTQCCSALLLCCSHLPRLKKIC